MLDLIGESEATRRFGRSVGWFVATRSGELTVARVGLTAERAVDLLHVLAVHLDPAVDVVIDSLRDRMEWRGELLPLPDVREVVGRLRLLLATYGGVEVTLVTTDDQLSLTPELLLVLCSRTDHWLYILDGLGFEERKSVPRAVWRVDRALLAPVSELSDALASGAERLGLIAVSRRTDESR